MATAQNTAVTLDTVAPTAPAIVSIAGDSEGVDGDSIISANDLATTFVSGTAEHNSTVILNIASIGDIAITTADASGNWSVNVDDEGLLAALLATEANFDITATATDAAGNTSGDSASFTITFDNVIAAPVITGVSGDSTGTDGDGVLTNADIATTVLSGSAEANSTVVVSVAGVGEIGTVQANSSGSWSMALADANALPAIPAIESTFTFTAVATDVAGNQSAASAGFNLTFDNIAPNAPAITGISGDAAGTDGDAILNAADVATTVVSGTAEAFATVILSVNAAGDIASTTATSSGQWSVDLGDSSFPAIPPGIEADFNLVARAIDVAGNESGNSSALTITFDNVAPSAPVITSITGDSQGTDGDGVISQADIATTVLSGTAEANSTVTLSINALGDIATTTADGSGNWSVALADTSGLPLIPAIEADFNIVARATDAAGNESAASNPFTITFDNIAPSTPTITVSGDDAGTEGDGFVTIADLPTTVLSGTAEANSMVTITVVGEGAFGVVQASPTGEWSFNLGGTALAQAIVAQNLALDATASFVVTATDTAGNTSADSAPLVVTIDTIAPVVSIDNFTVDTGESAVDHLTHDSNPELAGTTEVGSTVTGTLLFNGSEILVDGSAFTLPASVDGSGNWNWALNSEAVAALQFELGWEGFMDELQPVVDGLLNNSVDVEGVMDVLQANFGDVVDIPKLMVALWDVIGGVTDLPT